MLVLFLSWWILELRRPWRVVRLLSYGPSVPSLILSLLESVVFGFGNEIDDFSSDGPWNISVAGILLGRGCTTSGGGSLHAASLVPGSCLPS